MCSHVEPDATFSLDSKNQGYFHNTTLRTSFYTVEHTQGHRAAFQSKRSGSTPCDAQELSQQ